MDKYGLIGQDISYSKSPLLHRIIGETYGIYFTYELIDVLDNEINDVLKKDYKGFNITKPYKEVCFKKVDKYTKIAKNVEAINTIYKKNNKLYGDNTDYHGFKYLIKYHKIKIRNKKILILGTGGAAKVVYYYLKKFTNQILFVSRSKKDNITINYEEIINYQYDIIVNATPNGLYPMTDEKLISNTYLSDKIFIDLIYNPRETKMMAAAKESYNGLIMLIVQALYANKRWHKKIKITNEKIDLIKRRLEDV